MKSSCAVVGVEDRRRGAHKGGLISRAFLTLLTLTSAAALAQGVTIDHAGVACIVAGRLPRLDATIGPAARIARARAFFHADDDSRWYFVEMKPDAGTFHAVLPAPLKSTKRIHYYIEATDKGLAENRTREYAPEVVADAGACSERGAVAAIAVAAKVVVGASAGAAGAPAGFAANSVAVAGAAGGGLGATALVLGGVAVAGGAAAAIAVAAGAKEGGSSSANQDIPFYSLEGTVYSDPCCPAGLVDPAARGGSRRIQGAVVSTSLDSATATSDAQGFFRLTTQTRCPFQGASQVWTLTIAASGCDTWSETRGWGCRPTGQALNLICR